MTCAPVALGVGKFVPPAPATVGASLTAATSMVLVTPAEFRLPSLTTQVTVRLPVLGLSVLVFV